MTCDKVMEELPLYLYGEVAPDREEEIEAHVHACAGCRQELEKHRRIIAALDDCRLTASSMMLMECRQDLARAVEREKQKPRLRNWLTGVKWTWVSLRPAGAVALVALGFFSARLMTRDTAPVNMAGLGPEPIVSTIRSVQPDASGGIQIAYDETRLRMVTGKAEDHRIAQLLLAAARDEANAGLRVESLDILKDLPESDDVREVLIHALKQDANPGVRLKALEGLKPMAAHPEVRKALASVLLRDDNAGVRIQAIDLLVQHRDRELVGVLQNLVRKENNNYVRLRCKNALEEMNASVGTF